MPDIEPETIREAKAVTVEDEERRERISKMWIPFPLAGDDVYLMYGLGSLCQLEEDAEKLMPGYRDKGYSPFGVIEQMLLAGHPGAVRSALDAGLKRKGDPLPSGGFKSIPAADIDLDDDLPWPVSEIVTPALEAIAYSWFKKGYAEMIAEAAAAHEAAAEDARKAWQASRIGVAEETAT